MSITLNEEYCLNFPSIPHLSSKDRQLLSRAAFMTFFCTEDHAIYLQPIKHYVTRCRSYDSEGNRQQILVENFGQFALKEFLNLPEISCLIYQFKLKAPEGCYRYYQSVFNEVKKGEERCFIYWFRNSIVTCIQKAVVEKLGDNYGNITMEILCDTFNDISGSEFGWYCNLEEKMAFLGNKTFFNALCFYCSKEIVITVQQNSTENSVKLRLRNHFDFLFKQIECEQILATKTVKAFDRYHANNPDGISWFLLVPDFQYTQMPADCSEYISYPPTLNDNVYAAIHYYPEVTDFRRLMKVIKKLENYVKASDISNLVVMLSPKALMAVECWDLQEQLLFAKITDDFISSLDQTKQDSLFTKLEKIWMSEFKDSSSLSSSIEKMKL